MMTKMNTNRINNITGNINNNSNKDRFPLMRKATALWLIDNTSLTFKQIADFCNIHILEIEGMADGDVGLGITPASPIDNNQLTREMIEACEKDSNKKLVLNTMAADDIVIEKKKERIIPMCL